MTDEFAGFAAFGTTVTIDGVPIWGVGNISGPNFQWDLSDTTNHASPGRTEQRVATVKRIPPITFPMVLRPDDPGQQALYAAGQDPDVAHDFVITKPSGVTHTFEGFVSQWGDGADVTAHESTEISVVPLAWPDEATTFPGS